MYTGLAARINLSLDGALVSHHVSAKKRKTKKKRKTQKKIHVNGRARDVGAGDTKRQSRDWDYRAKGIARHTRLSRLRKGLAKIDVR